MRTRIAIVVSHPIPSSTPWYREIAAQPDVDLRVFFCCDYGATEYHDVQFGRKITWDVPLLDGYDSEFLPMARPPERLAFRQVDNPTVSAALDRFHPEVVLVHGYAHRTMWRVARWTRRNGRVLMLISDSNVSKRPAWWKRALKGAVVGHFYAHVDGAFSASQRNHAYHRQFGLPDERIFRGPFPADTTRMLEAVPSPAAARRDLRARWGIPDDAFVVLLCGKYAPHKRPLDLLQATEQLRTRGVEVWALLVGEGSERGALEAYIQATALRTAILTGFVNQAAIPACYAASDVVVLPSKHEAFGLAIVEALPFGCPVIASDQVGCVDAAGPAQPGVNAFVHAVGDVAALAAAIESLHRDPRLFASMRAASLRIGAEHTAGAAAAAFVSACRTLKTMGPRWRA